jgi:hypothetical protein
VITLGMTGSRTCLNLIPESRSGKELWMSSIGRWVILTETLVVVFWPASYSCLKVKP